eukprot:SAG11_NODE_526_length_8740_cov_27.364194_3_plen_36_part_00
MLRSSLRAVAYASRSPVPEHLLVRGTLSVSDAKIV